MSFRLPPRNPLPQLIPARMRHVQARIAECLWSDQRELDVLRSEEQIADIGLDLARSLPLQSLRPGDHLGRGGDHWTRFWLRIDIPAAAEGQFGQRHLLWQCQGETTVWIAGQPWAGLDIGHRSCPLPDAACTLWLELCCWQTGIWISMLGNESISPHGIRFDGAQVAVRDPLAWDCYCDVDAIVQMMEQALRQETDLKLVPTVGYCRALESVSPRLRKLLAEFDALADLWQRTHDLQVFHVACQDLFARWPAESWQPGAALCGHAHIDLVWLWPESATRKKIVHTVSTLLPLMERYPDMTFVQSMPALYRMLEQDAPQLMSTVKQHIASGRWEVVGAFEVEPDTNLPSGEALARSIAVGQRKIRELTGKYSEVAWIPDVFGYSQCLPQIMALGGVKYFFTIKMTWSKITKFPYTSFIWRGADGSEVLSHLGTTDYNGEVLLHMHEQAMAQHRQVAEHPELLLPVGYGDGGGGPADIHAERARRFRSLSGAPTTQWTRADAFFERMEPLRDKLPVYQGELYLEYHRGTYTTQSEFKRLYRRAERALQMHEAVRVAVGKGALPEESWLRVLFAHFHDAIPGSSIGQVYAEMNPELAEIGDREFALAAEALTQDVTGTEFVAFNSLPYARDAVVRHQQHAYQVHTPALGSAVLRHSADQVTCPILEASATQLRHERLTAQFNAQGHVTALAVDGHSLALDESTAFLLAPDDPAAFDAWDIDHDTLRLGTRVAETLVLRVVEHTPVRAVLESQPVALGENSRMTLRYILEAGSVHLRVEPTIDWQESHQLLRYVIPTSYRGRHARFGCPFGAIERPQLPGTESDEAMWEVPASRWAAVQRDGGQDGLALLAESKLGYAARDGVLSVSLLRSASWPDDTADRGLHTIPLALGRLVLEATEQVLSTSMAADALFTPPLVHRGRSLPELLRWSQLGSLNPCWCAPSREDPRAIFIRLHETAGRAGVAQLNLARRADLLERVDLLERPLETLTGEPDGGVSVAYQPWQILTLRIRLSDLT